MRFILRIRRFLVFLRRWRFSPCAMVISYNKIVFRHLKDDARKNNIHEEQASLGGTLRQEKQIRSETLRLGKDCIGTDEKEQGW